MSLDVGAFAGVGVVPGKAASERRNFGRKRQKEEFLGAIEESCAHIVIIFGSIMVSAPKYVSVVTSKECPTTLEHLYLDTCTTH